jgi:hypothetical protein
MIRSFDPENSCLSDIWDGSALRPLCKPGRYFSDQCNLALALSTDGVPLYKSSPISIWPVYLVILNLPAQVRMNAQNIILCGVWVGPTKPLMNLLLDPICECLQQLSTLGINIGDHVYRAKLVMGVFDCQQKLQYSVLNSSMVNLAVQFACIRAKDFPTMLEFIYLNCIQRERIKES